MRKELLVAERDDIFVIHEFLTMDECNRYIEMSEAAGYGDAPISTLGGPIMLKELRNNDRVMIDDVSLAESLWERLKPHMNVTRGSWAPIGLNERFRFYRYDPGQQFNWHYDGCYERSPLERSAFTFMIYLNGGCAGGATEFKLPRQVSSRWEQTLKFVQPETGKALVFVHDVLHRGAPVENGRKYVLRTDVMRRWISE